MVFSSDQVRQHLRFLSAQEEHLLVYSDNALEPFIFVLVYLRLPLVVQIDDTSTDLYVPMGCSSIHKALIQDVIQSYILWTGMNLHLAIYWEWWCMLNLMWPVDQHLMRSQFHAALKCFSSIWNLKVLSDHHGHGRFLIGVGPQSFCTCSEKGDALSRMKLAILSHLTREQDWKSRRSLDSFHLIVIIAG